MTPCQIYIGSWFFEHVFCSKWIMHLQLVPTSGDFSVDHVGSCQRQNNVSCTKNKFSFAFSFWHLLSMGVPTENREIWLHALTGTCCIFSHLRIRKDLLSSAGDSTVSKKTQYFFAVCHKCVTISSFFLSKL